MKIWDHIPDNIPVKTALCIGKFDGFHSGHRLLIEKAKETGLATAVLTFVFNRTSCIDSQPEKLRLAKELGIDHYIGIKAGEDFFSLTPEEFIRDIVKKRLNADHVIVGEDFRFGRNRSGDTATLKELSVRYGYEAVSVKKLRFSGEDIS
ncbi:MAG: hypothetical protein J6P16_01160, partial [Eubacterium sp.]|nr:hypothetical protein [Eubacterium sp.]